MSCAAPIVVHVRWMTYRDMPEVLAIEHASFESPWCAARFLRALRPRNRIGMVAEHDDRVVGFMVFVRHASRYHLVRLAVDPALRRRGVGRQLTAKLVGQLRSYWRTRVVVRVREANLDAQLFFRAQGFRALGAARAHYRDTGEDAYCFRYRIDTTDHR